MERRALRRLFVAAFRSHGLNYAEGGWQVANDDLAWSVSLHADGTGASAPYRLILGVSVRELGPAAPRDAWDCYLFLPIGFSEMDSGPPGLAMPDAVFPEWRGGDLQRRQDIADCVDAVVEYIRSVDSCDKLRDRYAAGDYDGAFMLLPMRSFLERSAS